MTQYLCIWQTNCRLRLSNLLFLSWSVWDIFHRMSWVGRMWEGIHKDHWSQFLVLHRKTPRITPCAMFQVLADCIQRILFSCYILWMTLEKTPGNANIMWWQQNARIKEGRSWISWQFCSSPSLLFLFCLYNGHKIWAGSMMSMHPLSIIDMMNNLNLLTLSVSSHISGNFIHQPHLKCLSNLSDVWSTETPLLEIYATNILSN